MEHYCEITNLILWKVLLDCICHYNQYSCSNQFFILIIRNKWDKFEFRYIPWCVRLFQIAAELLRAMVRMKRKTIHRRNTLCYTIHVSVSLKWYEYFCLCCSSANQYINRLTHFLVRSLESTHWSFFHNMFTLWP